MGLLGPMPTLGDPCHSHARRRRLSIHCGYSFAEGWQCRQVMEPDPRRSVRGQDLGWRGSVAMLCGARRVRSPWCSRRWVFKAGWGSTGNVPSVLSE